jgi:hypothetical protein
MLRNSPRISSFFKVAGWCRPGKISQRRVKMRLPNSIATWCLILFFFFFGLSELGMGIPGIILGLLALGVAIFTLIGR